MYRLRPLQAVGRLPDEFSVAMFVKVRVTDSLGKD